MSLNVTTDVLIVVKTVRSLVALRYAAIWATQVTSDSRIVWYLCSTPAFFTSPQKQFSEQFSGLNRRVQ